MKKFIKSIPFHIKSASKSLVRHFVMTLSASSAVMVTLILFSVFLVLAGNIGRFTENIENDIRIHVVLEKEIDSQESIERVYSQLQNIDNVKEVEFSSKENEIKMWVLEKGEIFSSYADEEANPLTHAFFVHVLDPLHIEKVNQEVLKIAGVRDAVYGGTSINSLVHLLETVRKSISVFVIVLVCLAVFLISNTIKMTIFARNHEISIMRNVGATNHFIKMPFVIEGMMIGVIGAIVPCILSYYGYRYLYNVLDGKLFTNIFALEPVYPFIIQIIYILIISGAFVGMLGSWFSTSKYLKWKR